MVRQFLFLLIISRLAFGQGNDNRSFQQQRTIQTRIVVKSFVENNSNHGYRKVNWIYRRKIVDNKSDQLEKAQNELPDPFVVEAENNSDKIYDKKRKRVLSEPCGQVTVRTDNIPATHHPWPWIVSLQADSYGQGNFEHVSTGVLIHSQWVLTTNNCINSSISVSHRIVVGIHDLSHFIHSNDIRKIGKLFVHHSSNLALIKLDRPMILNENVSLICLTEQPIIARKCAMAGWKFAKDGKMSHVLQATRVPVIANDLCTINNLCTFQHGACYADSGASLMCKYNQKWYASGVLVGEGNNNCASQPNLCRRVMDMYSWIENKLRFE